AARCPNIHRELLEQYKSKGLPDDTLLAQELVWERPEGQRFNRDTVGVFIERFKNTLAYAGVDVGNTIAGVGGNDQKGVSKDDPPPNPPNPPPSDTRIQRSRNMVAPAAAKEDVYTLAEGDAILQWPASIGRASAEDLEAWLALVIRKIKRAASVMTPEE